MNRDVKREKHCFIRAINELLKLHHTEYAYYQQPSKTYAFQ